MSDDQEAFAPFQPQEPMFETDDGKGNKFNASPAGKKRGPKKGAKKKAAESVPAVAAVPAKARKRSVARAIKIDLGLAMSALSGLQEDDAKFVAGVVQAMQPFAKKQRARIVAALSKIFA